jgi:hypothetical protein
MSIKLNKKLNEINGEEWNWKKNKLKNIKNKINSNQNNKNQN